MRFLRLIFVVALAILLVAVALANRETVTLSAFPANFGQYLGGRWSVALPLFLVIFLAFALGMLAGLVWEWLRESHIRRDARAHAPASDDHNVHSTTRFISPFRHSRATANHP